LQQTANGGAGGARTTIVADERTNSVLVSGDKASRLRLRTLITHLDTPLENGGDSRVRYLRYSDAIDLATKLDTQYSKGVPGEGAPPSAQSGSEISIWADEQTNALVITAPPKTMRSMMAVIDKIDIRRAQVMVEAIIVEVRADKAEELGVTWAVFNEDNAVAATQFPSQGSGIVGAITAVVGGGDSADASSAAGVIVPGVNIGVGRISETGTSFAALIQALESDADTNIVATPTLVTMDNEEAEINVGQEVPFVTGSFTNTGGTAGAVNPFQTIQREQVGLKLKITPQINEGDAVLLDIEQEISSVLPSTEAVDLVTSNRTVTTAVIVNDMSTLVIGGLLQDNLIESEQRVPILGSIPIVGALFRARSTELRKTNLMIFIKPTILRDNVATTYATNQKYDAIRNMQLADAEKSRPLLQDMSPPILPPLTDPNEASSRPAIDLRRLDSVEPVVTPIPESEG
jgi:general secretion pathway protein D